MHRNRKLAMRRLEAFERDLDNPRLNPITQSFAAHKYAQLITEIEQRDAANKWDDYK